jgi:hypothetical protein
MPRQRSVSRSETGRSGASQVFSSAPLRPFTGNARNGSSGWIPVLRRRDWLEASAGEPRENVDQLAVGGAGRIAELAGRVLVGQPA